MTVAQQANIIRLLRDIIASCDRFHPQINGLSQEEWPKVHRRTGGDAKGAFSPDPFIDETPTMMRNDYRIVFTNGDFAPRIIMVKGHVVIDWEHSGAYNA
ncbi:hypothetical protein DFH08DRAFT_1027169 [Mycena albidolilacea]|uniref:Uncharacterized protein n=1 Tax=Mycena albidolilacea TaxID=1033008 RepID=A0AAD6ZKH2_9AGAR|nr:hypothetical protein DFH08DRAFT_1027169 [Mycena albidolilacea]